MVSGRFRHAGHASRGNWCGGVAPPCRRLGYAAVVALAEGCATGDVDAVPVSSVGEHCLGGSLLRSQRLSDDCDVANLHVVGSADAAASGFALLTSLEAMVLMFGGMAAGQVAARSGYSPIFYAAALAAVLGAAVSPLLLSDREVAP